MNQPLEYLASHFDTFVAELKELLRIPSISTDPQHTNEVRGCAIWLVEHLKRMGVRQTHLIETGSHPLVYGEYLIGDSAPTVLVYGHYDVQPPDPIDLWDSQPFEPVIRDNAVFARGASDDKGQTFLILKALEALLKTGDVPCNVKLLLEGEEESGSDGVTTFVKDHPEKLSADVALVCDTVMVSADTPALTVSLRGIVYTELLLRGAKRDLHSGHYGGGVDNPIRVLAELISSFHDERHRVTVPGFYDDVVDLNDSQRGMLQQVPFDAKMWLSEIGVMAARTEAGYSVVEATTVRPCLEVNGIWGGYAGRGAKTVIPATAGAKISCRLVADQDPETIFKGLKSYVDQRLPAGMESDFRLLHKGNPIAVDTAHPAIKAAKEALGTTFGTQAFYVGQGGSIPLVALFKQVLGLDTVLMGFGLESDAVHSPNENFGLNRFRKGIESVIRFFENYAAQNQVTKGL